MSAAGSTCLNCGTGLAGRYCSQCGQRDAASRFRWRDLAHDVLAQVAELDHPWLRTVRDVTLDPGGTASMFVQGRRVVYVGPVKYAFYALLASVLFGSVFIGARNGAPVPGGWVGALLENTPVFVMLMSPLLAVLLRVVFLRSGHNLLEVGVFTLYMIAQTALAMLVLGYLYDLVRVLGFSAGGPEAAMIVVGSVAIVLPVYFLYAVSRFFRAGIVGSLIGALLAAWVFVWALFHARAALYQWLAA